MVGGRMRDVDPGPAVGAAVRRDGVTVVLLGGFEVLAADDVAVGTSVQRLVSALALNPPMPRDRAAALLWPDVPASRSSGRLRTTLWRLRRVRVPLVQDTPHGLALGPAVVTDVDRLARSVSAVVDLNPGEPVPPDAQECLMGDAELLPEWYDDWVLLARARLSSMRLRALDSLCMALIERGRPAEALEAGLASVRSEPLRESGHRGVLAAHLAEGNVFDARRHLVMATRLFHRELGVPPSRGILPLGWPG